MSPVRNRARSKAASPAGTAGAAISNGMRRGFSLIEIVIYAALLAIFIGASFAFIASILGSTDTLLERNEVITASEFIEYKMGWLAEQATSVTVPAAGGSSSTVVFGGVNPVLFPATFQWDGSAVTLALPTVASAPLTNDRVRVTSFLAEHFTSVQAPHTLRVSFVMESVIYPYLRTTSTVYYAISE